MPHNSFKILPGVDQTKTPALNEAAVSESQFIRFVPDRTLGGLVQKLGGWTKFFSAAIGSYIRCLWAWEDSNANSYLAVGSDGEGAAPRSLQVILNNTLTDITPQTITANVAVSFSTTSGSNVVTIADAGRNVDIYDVVYIKTQVSVGGLILFGQYQCYASGGAPNTYNILAYNVLGDEENATSTVVNGGAVPVFNTTSGSSFATVTLDNHGLVAGDTFPVLVATSVGGITFYGNYIVVTVNNANQFLISGSNTAAATTSGSENSGNVQFLYYNGIGPSGAGSGYGRGGYGRGEYGRGVVGSIGLGTGYGVGGYGRGVYGRGVVGPATFTGAPISAIDWTLDNWGGYLLASPFSGPIYLWNPNSGNPLATVIPNAPSANNGMFVAMPQRQIVAWGSTFTGIVDPMLIRWCDVNDYDQWIALITNQAGSYRIPKGSRIVQCIQAAQQGLIWTDLGLWAMQYAGPPYVYQFNELGTGCGLIGPKAAGSVSGVVYWMGPSQFYRLSGNGVEPIKCPVWDVIFQDLDMNNLDNIRFAANSRFGEVTWYYPTNANGGENSHYVKYNFVLDQWDFGQLSRTAWINESVLGPPIGAGDDTYIYQHETSKDADGQAMSSSFQTGYFAITEANEKMFIDQIWPDMKWGYYGGTQGANVLITFYVADYAGQNPTQYGPYTMTEATTFLTPRFRGRLVSVKIESEDIGSFWRLGNIRYRFQPDGRY